MSEAAPLALAPALAPVDADLPASARLVLAHLRAVGPRTHKDLLREVALPERTARYAVERLRHAGLVEAVPSLRDARQSYWRLR